MHYDGGVIRECAVGFLSTARFVAGLQRPINLSAGEGGGLLLIPVF